MVPEPSELPGEIVPAVPSEAIYENPQSVLWVFQVNDRAGHATRASLVGADHNAAYLRQWDARITRVPAESHDLRLWPLTFDVGGLLAALAGLSPACFVIGFALIHSAKFRASALNSSPEEAAGIYTRARRKADIARALQLPSLLLASTQVFAIALPDSPLMTPTLALAILGSATAWVCARLQQEVWRFEASDTFHLILNALESTNLPPPVVALKEAFEMDIAAQNVLRVLRETEGSSSYSVLLRLGVRPAQWDTPYLSHPEAQASPATGYGVIRTKNSEIALRLRLLLDHGYAEFDGYHIRATLLGLDTLALPPISFAQRIPTEFQRILARAQSAFRLGRPVEAIKICNTELAEGFLVWVLSYVTSPAEVALWISEIDTKRERDLAHGRPGPGPIRDLRHATANDLFLLFQKWLERRSVRIVSNYGEMAI